MASYKPHLPPARKCSRAQLAEIVDKFETEQAIALSLWRKTVAPKHWRGDQKNMDALKVWVGGDPLRHFDLKLKEKEKRECIEEDAKRVAMKEEEERRMMQEAEEVERAETALREEQKKLDNFQAEKAKNNGRWGAIALPTEALHRTIQISSVLCTSEGEWVPFITIFPDYGDLLCACGTHDKPDLFPARWCRVIPEPAFPECTDVCIVEVAHHTNVFEFPPPDCKVIKLRVSRFFFFTPGECTFQIFDDLEQTVAHFRSSTTRASCFI